MRASLRVAAFTLVASLGTGTLLVTPARGTDESDELVPGSVGIVKTGALAKFVGRSGPGPDFDLPDGTNDPRTEGATLDVFATSGPAGSDSYALPSGGWDGLGSPGGSKGYKYRGAGTPTDPCALVLVKSSVVKAICKGSVTVNPPLGASDLGVVLTVGTNSKRYCMAFGGTLVRDIEGFFKKRNAPPPVSCPTTSPSTTSSTATSTTSTTVTSTTINTPCFSSTYPTCGGSCPPGDVCQPVVSTGSSGIHNNCVCVDETSICLSGPAGCGAGRCMPGWVCHVGPFGTCGCTPP